MASLSLQPLLHSRTILGYHSLSVCSSQMTDPLVPFFFLHPPPDAHTPFWNLSKTLVWCSVKMNPIISLLSLIHLFTLFSFLMVLLLVTPGKETRGDRTNKHSGDMSAHWGKICELLASCITHHLLAFTNILSTRSHVNTVPRAQNKTMNRHCPCTHGAHSLAGGQRCYTD